MNETRAVEGRRARTRSADVERELLAAAETVLVREGPGGLTVRAVATEAGLSHMGVYNHLGGKDGLIEALLTQLGRDHRAEDEGVAEHVAVHVASGVCRSNLLGVLDVVRVVVESGGRPPE